MGTRQFFFSLVLWDNLAIPIASPAQPAFIAYQFLWCHCSSSICLGLSVGNCKGYSTGVSKELGLIHSSQGLSKRSNLDLANQQLRKVWVIWYYSPLEGHLPLNQERLSAGGSMGASDIQQFQDSHLRTVKLSWGIHLLSTYSGGSWVFESQSYVYFRYTQSTYPLRNEQSVCVCILCIHTYHHHDFVAP